MCALSISVPLARKGYYIIIFEMFFSLLARPHTPKGTYLYIGIILSVVFFYVSI